MGLREEELEAKVDEGVQHQTFYKHVSGSTRRDFYVLLPEGYKVIGSYNEDPDQKTINFEELGIFNGTTILEASKVRGKFTPTYLNPHTPPQKAKDLYSQTAIELLTQEDPDAKELGKTLGSIAIKLTHESFPTYKKD